MAPLNVKLIRPSTKADYNTVAYSDHYNFTIDLNTNLRCPNHDYNVAFLCLVTRAVAQVQLQVIDHMEPSSHLVLALYYFDGDDLEAKFMNDTVKNVTLK